MSAWTLPADCGDPPHRGGDPPTRPVMSSTDARCAGTRRAPARRWRTLCGALLRGPRPRRPPPRSRPGSPPRAGDRPPGASDSSASYGPPRRRREPAALLAGPGGLDRGVERQQVGLPGDPGDRLDDPADLLGLRQRAGASRRHLGDVAHLAHRLGRLRDRGLALLGDLRGPAAAASAVSCADCGATRGWPRRPPRSRAWPPRPSAPGARRPGRRRTRPDAISPTARPASSEVDAICCDAARQDAGVARRPSRRARRGCARISSYVATSVDDVLLDRADRLRDVGRSRPASSSVSSDGATDELARQVAGGDGLERGLLSGATLPVRSSSTAVAIAAVRRPRRRASQMPSATDGDREQREREQQDRARAGRCSACRSRRASESTAFAGLGVGVLELTPRRPCAGRGSSPSATLWAASTSVV